MQVLHMLNNNQCSTSPKTKVQNVQEQKDLIFFSIFQSEIFEGFMAKSAEKKWCFILC